MYGDRYHLVASLAPAASSPTPCIPVNSNGCEPAINAVDYVAESLSTLTDSPFPGLATHGNPGVCYGCL